MLWRNWLACVAVLATVLGMLVGLAVLQYDATLTRLIQERLAVIAETAGAPIRAVIDLGLPISAMRSANQVLAAAKEIDSAVTSIMVFDDEGRIVHAVGGDAAGVVPAAIRQRQSLSGGDRWTFETESELISGLTLRNPGGAVIGGLLVNAANQDFAIKSASMALKIGAVAFAIFVASAAIAFVILRLRLAGVMQGLAQLQNLAERFADDRRGETRPEETFSSSEQFGFLTGEIYRLEGLLSRAFNQYQAAREQLMPAMSDKQSEGAGNDLRLEAERSILASVPETALARIFARHLTPWIAAIILGSALLLGFYVNREVTRSFEPELSARTQVIGTVANRNVQKAINAGVPLEQLVGAESYFDDLLRHFPEISYFGIATGRIVYEAGTRQQSAFAPARARKDVPTFPINAGGEQIGYIIIDANPDYFAVQFRDMLLDFAVVVLVVLLLAFQIMTVVMSRSLTAPFMRLQYLASLQAAGDFSKVVLARGVTAIERLSQTLSWHAIHLHRGLRAAGPAALAAAGNFQVLRDGPARLQFTYLNDVRLPLFLFAAADELPLAFFPLFTKAADNPLTWLDPGVVVSLPLAGYLVAIVFGSPLARPLAERFGHRKLLLFAVIPTLAAHLGLYFAGNVVEIVVLRTVTGFGYAIATLCCQDYVLDVVPKNDRYRSLGLFTATMFSGIFAGAALGGVLADRLGQPAVFAISALLVAISGYLAYLLLPAAAREGETAAAVAKPGMPPILKPLRSARFAALVFGVAIPANILIQAFISLLVALELHSIGASAADVGRTLMSYFLAIVFIGPVAPRLFADKLDPARLALLGAILSALALIVYVIWPTPWAMSCVGVPISSRNERDSIWIMWRCD